MVLNRLLTGITSANLVSMNTWLCFEKVTAEGI
jgi:hypothetical protein